MKEKKNINVQCREHFSSLPNKSSTVHPAVLDQIPKEPTINSLDLPPTMEEVEKAMKQSSSKKAPGTDKIPTEIYKAAGPVTLETFYSLLINIWEEEKLDKDFKDARAVPLFKNKCSKADCGNYQGICLLSIAWKVRHMSFLTTLSPAFQKKTYQRHSVVSNLAAAPLTWFLQSDSQRRSVSKRIESICCLYRYSQGIWYSQQRSTLDYTIKTQVSEMICQPHSPFSWGHHRCCSFWLGISDSFVISNNVKQSCVLPPVLVNLFFTYILTHAVRDLDHGLYLRYRLEGSLFDLKHLSAKIKTL